MPYNAKEKKYIVICSFLSFFSSIAKPQPATSATPNKADTLKIKEYKPEIFTSGFIDVMNNGQVNASARFIRLFIGEPGKFAIPLSLYGGVSNNNFQNQNSDLVNNNLSNTNILSYSLDEEGLEVIEQLDNGNTPSGLSCRRAGRETSLGFAYRNNRHRLDMKVVYQRFFIIHSLEGKAKTQKRVLGIWWHHNAGNAYMSHIQLDYQRRCSGGFSHWGSPAGLPGYTTGSTCHYQPYMSARGLKNYFYQIDFVSTHGSGRVKIEDY